MGWGEPSGPVTTECQVPQPAGFRCTRGRHDIGTPCAVVAKDSAGPNFGERRPFDPEDWPATNQPTKDARKPEGWAGYTAAEKLLCCVMVIIMALVALLVIGGLAYCTKVLYLEIGRLD